MTNSKISIYAGLVTNIAISIIKFIAAFFSGSSAMLSEGIHSAVDTCNELLLLLGISRSKRPPDLNHPFGHGKEVYFWSLIVSILIFGLGGGMSIYEGINHIRHPLPVKDPFWNYIVLMGAFLFETVSLILSIHYLIRKKQPEGSFWKKLRSSKDPALFVVIYENGAAVAGLLIAFTGIFLSQYYKNPFLDGAASVLIGIVLAVVAIIMVSESHNLLIGESAQTYLVKELYTLVNNDKNVHALYPPLTMQMSPNEVLVALDVQFTKELNGDDIVTAIAKLEISIKKKFPEITRIYMEARNLSEKANMNQQGTP